MTTDTRTQHTPGPWEVREDADGRTRIMATIWDGSAKMEIVSLKTGASLNVRPDARLIAAAPDLLAALELARQALVNLQAEGESRYMPIVRQANAAIAKARGEE